MLRRDRFPRYLQFGDLKVFAAAAPQCVAGLMKAAYLDFIARTTTA